MHPKDEAVIDLMGEIAWLIEQSGDLAMIELVDLQREFCRWHRIWPIEKARTIPSLRALQVSKRILEISGLLQETPKKREGPFLNEGATDTFDPDDGSNVTGLSSHKRDESVSS